MFLWEVKPQTIHEVMGIISTFILVLLSIILKEEEAASHFRAGRGNLVLNIPSPFSTEFSRHCVLSGVTHLHTLSNYKSERVKSSHSPKWELTHYCHGCQSVAPPRWPFCINRLRNNI